MSLGQKYLTATDPFAPNYNNPDQHRDLKKLTCPSGQTIVKWNYVRIGTSRLQMFCRSIIRKTLQKTMHHSSCVNRCTCYYNGETSG